MNRAVLVSVLLLTALGWTSAASAESPPPWTADFTHRMHMDFNLYDREETLVEFPVLVALSEALPGFSYGQFASPTGGDLRFTGSDLAEFLYYDIEEWNTNGTSYVWVQIPELVRDLTIWAYWGNSNDLTPPPSSDARLVWQNGFQGVYHLNEMSGTHYDATPHGRDLVVNGGRYPGARAVIAGGKYGGGQNNAARLEPGYLYDPFFLNAFSERVVSAWVTVDSTVGPNILYEEGSASGGLAVGYRSSPLKFSFVCAVNQVSREIQSVSTFPPSYAEPVHVVAMYLGGAMSLYINGKLETEGSLYSSIPYHSNPAAVGGNYSSTAYDAAGQTDERKWHGIIDEFRLADVARSSNWVWAAFLNVASNESFAVYSPVEPLDSSVPAIFNVDAVDVDMFAASLRGYLASTGAAPTRVAMYWGENDGGTNSGSWSNRVDLGIATQSPPSMLTASLGDLTPRTTYHYRFHASNDQVATWAPSTSRIVTPDSGCFALVAAGATWRYLDDGSDQGSDWRDPAFPDSGWAVGAAQFGYGDGDETTLISYGGDPWNRYVTTYFRHTFSLSSGEVASASRLRLHLLRDDGAITYINGQEVFRSNMPNGPVNYRTPARSDIDDATGDEDRYFTAIIDGPPLHAGTNVVAVEVHQEATDSPDLSFDLAMDGIAAMPQVGFVPGRMLADFRLVAQHDNLPGQWRNDHSACCLDPDTGEMLVMLNRGARWSTPAIQVYGQDGSYRRRIEMPDWFDAEGICVVDAARRLFGIVEETCGDVTVVTIAANTAVLSKSSGIVYATKHRSANNGLEGVTFDPHRNCFYLVKEYDPIAVYRLSGTPGREEFTELFDAVAALDGLAGDLSDLHYDPDTDRLYLLSDESACVIECDVAGKVYATYPLTAPQAEGITFSDSGSIMHVISEPNHYYRYQRSATVPPCIREGSSTACGVALSWPWLDEVWVELASSGERAVYGVDYSNSLGSATSALVFPVGVTTQLVELSILEDTISEEEDQSLRLALLSASGAYLGDRCETWYLILADSVTNATPIWWLELYYGPTNDYGALAMSDTDGDGMLAWEEFVAGTCPTDGLDCLRITHAVASPDGTGMMFSWNTVSGKHYTVITSGDALSRWTNVPDARYTNISAAGSFLTYTNSTPDAQRFYRVKVQRQ